jgi:hypothetical protein
VAAAALAGCGGSESASPSPTSPTPPVVTSQPTGVFVASVDVNPSVFESGQAVQGSLELSGPAPADGLVVALASSDTAVATVDASLTVPAGASSARFSVSTRAVPAETLVTISATAGGQTRGKTIRLGASAPIVFHDTLNAPGSRSNAVLYPSSWYGTLTLIWNVADDFVSSKPGSIRTIRWQGGYCDDSVSAAPVPEPVARQFFVTLLRDDGNSVPGATAWEGVFTPSEVREERVFEDGPRSACHLSRPAVPSYSAYYQYTLTLNTPVPVLAGQKYWLRIAAEVGRANLKWGWRQGLADNNWSHPSFTNTAWLADMAFQLSSSN